MAFFFVTLTTSFSSPLTHAPLASRARILSIDLTMSGAEEALTRTLIVGLPLVAAVGFLKLARFEPSSHEPSIQDKIWDARSTRAPGFTFAFDDDLQEGIAPPSPSPLPEDGRDRGTLALEDFAVRQRELELKEALSAALDREDYSAAAAIKRELETLRPRDEPSRREALSQALSEAVEREDYKTAASIKREIDGLP